MKRGREIKKFIAGLGATLSLAGAIATNGTLQVRAENEHLSTRIPTTHATATGPAHWRIALSYIPGLEYRFLPNDGWGSGTRNNWGLRGEDLPRRDADGELPSVDRPVIPILGDSFTEGMNVGDEETYPRALQRRFEEDGIDARVVNMGVSGYSARSVAAMFSHFAIPLTQSGTTPLAVYTINPNDLEYPGAILEKHHAGLSPGFVHVDRDPSACSDAQELDVANGPSVFSRLRAKVRLESPLAQQLAYREIEVRRKLLDPLLRGLEQVTPDGLSEDIREYRQNSPYLNGITRECPNEEMTAATLDWMIKEAEANGVTLVMVNIPHIPTIYGAPADPKTGRVLDYVRQHHPTTKVIDTTEGLRTFVHSTGLPQHEAYPQAERDFPFHYSGKLLEGLAAEVYPVLKEELRAASPSNQQS